MDGAVARLGSGGGADFMADFGRLALVLAGSDDRRRVVARHQAADEQEGAHQHRPGDDHRNRRCPRPLGRIGRGQPDPHASFLDRSPLRASWTGPAVTGTPRGQRAATHRSLAMRVIDTALP